MRLEIHAPSLGDPGAVHAYPGPCEPIPSSLEESEETVVLTCAEESVSLYAPVEVPGAEGGRWLADNSGRGFAGDDGPVNFRAEACRTRVRLVEELARQLEDEGMPPSPSATKTICEVRAALDVGRVDKAVEGAFWAGERLVEAEVEWRLRGTTKLDFGINTKGLHNAREAWDRHFAGRFDYATVPLTWGVLEVEEDNPRYDVLDELVAWGQEQSMAMGGHALIWHSGFETRTWLSELNFGQVLARSAERVRNIMQRIGPGLDAVELTNEPMQANRLGFSLQQELQEVEQAYRICKEMAPHVRHMISFYSEDEAWYSSRMRDGRQPITIAEFIERCIDRGVEPDLLGLQYHMPENLFNVRQVGQFWHDRFGLPLHITELTPPSGAEPSRRIDGRPMDPYLKSWRGRPWSEEVQADYVRSFLRLFRALPFFENATFWATTDAPILWHDYLFGTPCEDYRLPWAAGQGLLREDLSPKPALDVIDEIRKGTPE
ncbi:MAG: endo-1,4-beta-xylanase [Candidatus Brocadiia bacterium]